MQEKHLYEYAVIRVMPKVEREEFINVGIILYCKNEKFLKIKFNLNTDRLKAFSADIEINELENYLKAWEAVCEGGNAGGEIGQLPIAARFRWLTATRSTVLQTSKVHPGFCDSASSALETLYQKLVE